MDGQPQYVTTGDVITAETGFLRGHGTQTIDDELVATISGFVERVNKLISVRPLNSRYQGEVGDVIVGRIGEVGDKVWRVDVNSRQNGVLMLSSVNLPGGVQRRRTHADALQMRTFFEENDLISAEVQKLMHDGAISLHTRNAKYGKLMGGQFINVPPLMIKRCKQHFHSLENGVDLILGNNGYVWIQPSSTDMQEDSSINSSGTSSVEKQKNAQKEISASMRENISRVRNSVMALSTARISIYRETVMDVYNESLALGMAAKDLLNPELLATVTQLALARSQSQQS